MAARYQQENHVTSYPVWRNVDAVRMRTLNKVMAARYQQENHVTSYPVLLYRSVIASADVQNGEYLRHNVGGK